MKIRSFLRSDPGKCLVLILLFALCVWSMIFSLKLGALKLSPAQIFEILWNRPDGIRYQIVCNIRLPRILCGSLVGAALAVSGAIPQSVMRNPLAAPGIIGVSAGGGLAGILVLLALPQYSVLLVPAAFVGALLTALLVYLLAWRQGVSPVRLILSGVAVAAMLGAVSSAILLFNAEKAGGVLDFTIGSLTARSWKHLQLSSWYLLAGLAGAFLFSEKLNVLTLGDEVARGLGLHVERIRFSCIAIAALLAAGAVSIAGLLGFVGLIAPHIVRIVIGSDNRFLLPGSALFGAFLVTACDTAGRLVIEPSELPAGIIMALLGPPFFLWLLRGCRYEA